MIKTRLYALTLCAAMFLSMLPMTAQAADTVTEVGTFAQLKAALTDTAGAHVRLTADITLTKADAWPEDPYYGIVLGEGFYTIDLNGHKIEYSYMPARDNYEGSPLFMQNARALTINGPGSVVGGTHGMESGGRQGLLTINGATLYGRMNSGLRLMNGVCVVNSGELKGNFNGIWQEGGVLVLNGGRVSSISNKQMGQDRESYGLVKNGVFTGQANLTDVVMMMNDLTISQGSSINLARQGGLIVKGSFVNNGTLTYEAGLQSLGGEAVLKAASNMGYVYITEDVTFKTLTIEANTELYITNGATVTVSGAFVNCGGVVANNGVLVLQGSIDNRGHSEGVAALVGTGGGPAPGSGDWGFGPAYDDANRLYDLGLFKGVGTNPDGGPDFALERAPNRVETLVMLIRLLGKEAEAMSGDWTHPFTDVPGWANEYVGYAYENKLTNGVSATEFGTGNATAQMYLTFVLRSLGYSDAGGVDFKWDKPEALAESVGIMAQGVDLENFLRADVVMISAKALSAEIKDSGVTLLDKLIADGAVTAP